jgi:hypothetical protein
MRHTVIAAALAFVIASGLAIGSMTMCGDTPGFCPNPPTTSAPADAGTTGVSGDW